MSIQGIDVSEFQGNIQWDRVKKAGIQFAMLRAGYGTKTIDPQFRRNAQGCNDVGIPCGVYWFSYAYTPEMARNEADQCMQAIEEYRIGYPVCIDFEGDSVRYAASRGVTVTGELATEMVRTFCERVEEWGYFAMYYSNLDFLNRYFASSLRSDYALWFAQYAAEPQTSGMAIWQKSNTGRVDGISGNVDLDVAYYDLAAVIEKAGLNKGGTHIGTKPDSGGQAGTETVYTVKSGDTLSEIARRFGTTYQELAAYNGIADANLIYPGEKIRIPQKEGSGSYYTIQYGDTLSGVAQRFGTSVGVLQNLNGISNPNRIYAGERIRIR